MGLFRFASKAPSFGPTGGASSSSQPPPLQAPGSPTLSAATLDSTLTTRQADLGQGRAQVIISQAHLAKSVNACSTLIASSRAYRDAIKTLSHATTNFAVALEEASQIKGAKEVAGPTLQASAGIHYMLTSTQLMLSSTLQSAFEAPLADSLKEYIVASAARQKDYEAIIALKTDAIRTIEQQNMNQGRKRNHRDLDSFRKALEQLQERVREIEAIKRRHYEDVYEGESQLWDNVGTRVSHILRSTFDLSDRISSKSADPVIEGIFLSTPDPFGAYSLESGSESGEGDVFTVLAPLDFQAAAYKSSKGVIVEEGEASSEPEGQERGEEERVQVLTVAEVPESGASDGTAAPSIVSTLQAVQSPPVHDLPPRPILDAPKHFDHPSSITPPSSSSPSSSPHRSLSPSSEIAVETIMSTSPPRPLFHHSKSAALVSSTPDYELDDGELRSGDWATLADRAAEYDQLADDSS